LDLTIKAQRSTTGILALDVPVRITAQLDNPTIGPVLDADAGAIARRGLVNAGRLAEPMRALATGSACLR
jgi:hypothetical protein